MSCFVFGSSGNVTGVRVAVGENGVAYLTYPVSHEDVKKRALSLHRVQEVLLHFVLAFSPGFNCDLDHLN